MKPTHIDELTEILAHLRTRLGEIKRQSDPFAGIVLDDIEEHVRLSDNLLCRLLNAQTRAVPTWGGAYTHSSCGSDCPADHPGFPQQ